MNRKFFESFIKILQVMVFASLILLASCGEDSGLGGAIDTKAPTLSIDYPKESGSAIRDSFILAGSVSDDKSISKVTVSVKSLDDGGKISDTYSAAFDIKQKRWWIDLNKHDVNQADYKNGWQYPDGNYEFSVTAFDNAGNNSGTYSKTFEIDNTPPLFIISNPGVVKKSNLSPSAYGSIFTIDGTISDNHTISFMDVKIFDASGTCVSSESYEGENLPYYREEDVATAGGTSVQIAQYGAAAVNSRYSQLHPSDTGTDYYYAQITLTDSTKVYRNPWGDSARSVEENKADELGNSTSKLYLYDDVYTNLMSAKKGLGLSAANLKDIISGVYDGEKDAASVLAVLNEKVCDTSASSDSDPMSNKLSFSLNPEANPTYNVNGFVFGFGENDTVQSASQGNTVSVTISAGLDGTNIAPENVRVWMKKYDSKPTDEAAVKADLHSLEKSVESLERTETDFMDSIHASPETPATSVTTGGVSWILVYDYSLNNSKGSSVTTKTFSVTLPEGIELSKYYILGVTGYDIEDVEFSQNTVYGFEGNTAGVPPTIKIESPTNLSVWADFATPEFSGTAVISTSSLYLTELTATMTVEDESNSQKVGEYFDTITCKIENDEKVWTLSDAQALTWDSAAGKWNLDATKLPGLKEKYDSEATTGNGVYWLATLTVSGKSSSGHKGEITQSIHIDTVKPVISFTSVTPSVSGSDYFEDKNDTYTYLNGTVTIRGNIEEQNFKDDEDAVTCDIWASTDLAKELSASDSILADLVEHRSEFGLGNEFDGKLGKVFSVNIPFDTKAITDYFHKYKGAAEDQKIQIEVVITATDKAGKTNFYSSKTLNGGKNYVIYQETDRPKIMLGNADKSITTAAGVKLNKNLFGKTSNNRLQISFSDDDEIAEYELTVFDENGTPVDASILKIQAEESSAMNPYTFEPKQTTATLNYTLPAEEAKYQILIKARDKLSTGLNQDSYGKKTVGNFFVAVDSGAPEIEITKPTAGSYESGTVTANVTLSKNVEPTADLYKLNNSGSYEKVGEFTTQLQGSEKVKKESDGVYKWIGTANVSDSSGTFKIIVNAKDLYDQEASKDRVFYVDTEAPSVGNPATTDQTLVELDNTSYVAVTSVIEDSPAGVSAAKYFLSMSSVSKTAEEWKTSFSSGTGWTQMNKGSENYNASVNVKGFSNADGKVYVYVGAADSAGNIAVNYENPLEFTLDKQAPVISSVTGFGGSGEIADKGTSTTRAYSASFNVVVTDTNIVSLESSNSNVNVGTGLPSGENTTYPVTVKWSPETGNIEDEKANVLFTATDANGRKAARTVTLKCDNYAPRVTLTPYGKYQTKSLELSGTVTDKNFATGSDNLKVYLVPSSGTAVSGRVSFTPNTADSYKWSASLSELEQFDYNIVIVTKDTFGNLRAYSTNSAAVPAEAGFSGTPESLTGDAITVDTTPPTSELKIKLAGTAGITGKVVDSSKTAVSADASGYYVLEANKTYYVNDTFSLEGVIVETNLDTTSANKPKLTAKKERDAANEVTFTNGGNASGAWSYVPSYSTDGTADASYQYTLTLNDLAGQSFEAAVTIILDTKAPEVSFTSPGEGESFEGTPTAKIAYSDDGVGIDSERDVSIEVYNITNTSILSDSNKLTKDSHYFFIPGTSTGSLAFASTYTNEGTFKIKAKVKDYLGHESMDNSDTERTFYYDSSKPTVTESQDENENVLDAGVGESGLTTNAESITLKGVVYDTNALASSEVVKISGTWNGSNRVIQATLTRTTENKTVTANGKTYTLKGTQYATWTYTFYTDKKADVDRTAENYLPDGSYTFAIIATDVAGKTSQISRTVRVDTVAPDLGTPAVTTTKATKTVGTTTEDWYKTDSLRFEGTASDSGTGIASVSYQTSEDNGTAWTTAAPLSGTTSWSGTISGINSKTTKVKIIVADNAGNTKVSEVLGPWNIDTTEPTLTAGSVKADSNAVSEESPYYSRGNKTGNPSPAATVTFKVEDETNGSGIQKVDVQIYSKATDSTSAIHADVADDGSCTATIPATSITKSGTVYARIYDYAGNYSDVNLFALTYDATDPVIQSATLKDSSDYTAYKPNQDVEKYYVNNTDGNFTLSGIATDNLGLKSAKLELKEGSNVKKTYEITDETKLSDWKFEIGSDLSTLSLTATETSPLTAALTVTDKAGNKATKDIAIVFDTTKPAALHNFDSGSTPKDAVFRIGEDDNDPAETGAALTAKDKDVGGKYAPGTYGKANTITVRGYFTEDGSGLQYVYYKVFSQSTAPSADQINTFVSNYKTEKTGYFSAIAEETKNVKFNTSDSVYEFGDIKTNFKSTISEFGIGKNYLVLVGVDYVGNAAVDGISYTPTGSSTSLNCYSINVDVEAPTVERVLADGESSTLLTNASSADLVLKGTAIDNPTGNAAGIKSLSASIKVKESSGTEKTYTSTDTTPQISIVPTDNNTKWTVMVKKEIFENVDAGNFSVYVTATDNAGTGNSQTANVGTITVDKIKPTVTLALPTDADTSTAAREINGIIDLSGTVKDANPLPETSIVAIQYIKKDDYTETDDSESEGTKWVTLTNDYKGESGKEMSALSLSGDYTFDIKNFDTTKIEPLNEVVYYIRAKAVDKAGNVGYSPIKDSNGKFIEITISQDSDRPVVKIVNLTEVTGGAYPYILKYGTKSQVIATVTDDDGIDNVYVSESAYTGTGTAPTTSVYVPTTGTLTFTPQDDTTANSNVDGEKKFYVYVKDTAGKEFFTTYYTDATAASTAKYLNVPKVKVNDTSLTDTANAAQFVYFSDSTSPEVGVINALSYKEGTNATTPGAVNGGLNNTTGKYTEYEGVNASYVIGGTERQWVQFQISASDASGISGIYMEVSYKDKSNVQQTIKRRTSAAVGTEGIVSADDTFEPAKEADGTTDSRTTKIWTTDKISFANAKGNISLKIIPYDASGLQGNGQVTFVADTTGPEIKVTSPESTDEVTGTVTVVGISTDQGGSKTSSTKWLIPTRTQRKMTDADTLYSATKDLWLETGFTAKSTASSWTFELKSSEISAYDTDGSDNASGTDTGYAQSVADGVYILPFYVLSTDELGNRTIKRDYTIKHNPDADRPRTTISYPDQSGRTLGGTIRVTGESIIPAGEATVKAVYLQIGTVTNGVASFGDAAKTKASAAVNIVGGVNNGGYHYTVKTPADVKSDNGFATDLNFGAGVSSSAWWGIPVTKTSSAWNFSLNANGELDPASGETNHIAIRACAVNSDGKVGAWSTTYFVDVDSTAPTQIATLRQFASSGENAFSTTSIDSNLSTTKASAIRSYEAEMYLKGDWYLTVQLDDESLLESYSVKKGNQTLTSGYYASSKTWTYSDNSTSTGDTATAGKTVKHVSRTIFIPVDKTDEKVDYTVTVTDSNETGGHTINAVYSLRIDNTAPSITKIYKGSDSENSPELTQNYTVNDENYIFTLGGKVTENGSGFERVVFYYVRENDASKNYNRQAILDPLVTSASGTADSKAYLFDEKTITDETETVVKDDPTKPILTKRTFSQDSTHSYELWALAVTGTMKADGYTFEAGSSLSGNKHIRTGGLIEVGGVLRRIESISDTTVRFDSNTGVTADTETTAYFPYAQVVDNTNTEKTESTAANPFTFQSGDDGDKMPETVSGSKSTGFIWDSSVHTTNIPDGPAKLVVLVFDKAGNVSGQTYTVKVENSAPRLAKVFLGTDLNSNGSWQANEFVGYDLYNANETYGIGTTEVKASQTIQTASYGGSFIIKDKLAVVAEFVGGNGDIIMVYGKDATGASAVPLSNGISAAANETITSLITATDKIGSVTYNKKTVTTSLKGFTLTSKQVVGLTAEDATIAETNDGTGKKASFTFWDSTEELVQGSTSQNCVLYVTDFAIDLHDGIAPKTVINPFYWNGIKENSIYDSASASTSTDLKGHIEFEDDLIDDIKNFDAESTAYGSDPKVSGIVTFTGTAYDEHALSEINFSFGSYMSGTIATYKSEDSTWTAGTGTLASDGWKATVSSEAASSIGYYGDDIYFGQRGHKVYWTLSIDTEKISDVAKLDVVLSVTAKDLTGNLTSTTNVSTRAESNGDHSVTDGTTNLPTYKMDVVPYIVGVKTSLSSLKKNRSSVYDRTALGHYPVASTETIYVYGFNLNGGSLADNASHWVDLTKITPTTSYKWYSEKAAPVASVYSAGSIENFKSGTLWAYVKGVWALNNFNDNDARDDYEKTTTSATGDYSIYANYPNRQPNNDSNNRLTDDVVLDVWYFNSRAAVPKGTGRLNDPVMKISPKNGMIHFAFADGPLFFAMGGGYYGGNSTDHTSYDYWVGGYDFFDSVGFAVDDIGHTYGVAAGGDINSTTADSFALYSSRWGVGSRANDGSRTGGHRMPVEVVAQKDSGGQITFDKYRFNNSPSLATVAHGNNTNSNTSVYLAYYDNINDEIRFRCGQLNNTPDSNTEDFGTFTSVGDSTPKGYTATATLIAGRTAEHDTGYNAGSYVSIAPVKTTTSSYTDDVLVIVWYDQTNSRMMYAYSSNPIGKCAAGEYTPGADGNGWEGYEEVFSDGIGQYCKVAVDVNGGIHVAAYDSSNGDLWYAYKSSYNGGTWQKYIVDSSGIVGSEITLDVALDSAGNAIPYIGYYATSIVRPKYAWLAKPALLADGVVEDAYTGVWETTIVPTSSTVPADNINVGVWKTSAGVRTTSISETWVKDNTNYNGSNATNPDGNATNGGYSWGYAWANATDNPMMAYQVGAGSSGTLETAQMQ